MAKLADALDSGSSARKGVEVQLLLSASLIVESGQSRHDPRPPFVCRRDHGIHFDCDPNRGTDFVGHLWRGISAVSGASVDDPADASDVGNVNRARRKKFVAGTWRNNQAPHPNLLPAAGEKEQKEAKNKDGRDKPRQADPFAKPFAKNVIASR